MCSIKLSAATRGAVLSFMFISRRILLGWGVASFVFLPVVFCATAFAQELKLDQTSGAIEDFQSDGVYPQGGRAARPQSGSHIVQTTDLSPLQGGAQTSLVNAAWFEYLNQPQTEFAKLRYKKVFLLSRFLYPMNRAEYFAVTAELSRLDHLQENYSRGKLGILDSESENGSKLNQFLNKNQTGVTSVQELKRGLAWNVKNKLSSPRKIDRKDVSEYDDFFDYVFYPEDFVPNQDFVLDKRSARNAHPKIPSNQTYNYDLNLPSDLKAGESNVQNRQEGQFGVSGKNGKALRDVNSLDGQQFLIQKDSLQDSIEALTKTEIRKDLPDVIGSNLRFVGRSFEEVVAEMAAEVPEIRRARLASYGEPDIDLPPDLANGKKAFRIYCAECHGIDGSGPPPERNHDGKGIGPYGSSYPFIYIPVYPMTRQHAGGKTPKFSERSASGLHATIPDMTPAAVLSHQTWADLQAYVVSIAREDESRATDSSQTNP